MKKGKLLTAIVSLLAAFSLISCGDNGTENPPINQTEKFTVVFNTNGGSSVASQEVESGKKATKPTDPTKEGYEFKGWFEDIQCTKEFSFDSEITANTNIYAKWEKVETEVSYSATLVYNNGQANGTLDAVLDGGMYYIDKPADPSKEYMEFDFWAADSEGTTKFNFANPITGNVTLYAIYKQAYDSVNTIFDFNEAASTIVANPSGNVSITSDTQFGRFTIGAGARFEINGSTDCINTQGKEIHFELTGDGTNNGITISGKGASGSGDLVTIKNEDTGEIVYQWSGVVNGVEFDGSYQNLVAGHYSITSTKSIRIYSLSLTEKLPQGPTAGIEINTSTVNFDFLLGRPFDYNGLDVSLVYENGRKDKIALDSIALNIVVEDFSTAGTKKVSISYQKDSTTTYTAEYNVNVYAPADLVLYNYVLNGSRVTQNRQEVFAVNSTFSATNLIVKASCLVPGTTDKYVEFLLNSSEYTLSTPDLTTAGQKSITATYNSDNTIAAEYKIEVINVPTITQETVTVIVNPALDSAVVSSELYSFKTITQALQFLELCNLADTVVKNVLVASEHVYNEKVEVAMPNVVMSSYDLQNQAVPTDMNKFAVVHFNGLAGDLDPSETLIHSTDGSATISIRPEAEGFVAKNISFVNYYNTHERYEESKKTTTNTQAVATLVQADKASFINVYFSSYQDTLYAQVGRHYFENCLIEGRTDFIFGYDSTSYFYNCEIKSIYGNSVNNGGYVVATKGKVSGNDNIKYGYIFDNCTFTAEEAVTDGSVSIARGWDTGMAVMVMNSTLDAHISKEAYGQKTADDPTTEGVEPEMNDRYCKMNADPNAKYLLEYNNTGAGAITESIENTCTVVDASIAKDYNTLTKVFGNDNGTVKYADNWAGPHVGKDVEITLMDGSKEIGKVYEYSGNKLLESHCVAPEKDIKFIGWYANSNLTTPYDFETVLTENQKLVLYAKYEAVDMMEYTLVVPPSGESWDTETALDSDGIFFATSGVKTESLKIEGASYPADGLEFSSQFSLTKGKVQVSDGTIINGIKLVLPKDAKITLYAAQKADKSTKLNILDPAGNVVTPENIKKNGEAIAEFTTLSITEVEKYEFNLAAGTYYLGGAGGGAYVYGLIVAVEGEQVQKQTISYNEVTGEVADWTVYMASAGNSKIGIEEGITHDSKAENYDASKVITCDKLIAGTDYLLSPLFEGSKNVVVSILCGTTSTSNAVNILIEGLDANGNVVSSVTALGPTGKVAGYAVYNNSKEIELNAESDIVQVRISCTTDSKNICVVSCDITK